jgi:hypothetical protein
MNVSASKRTALRVAKLRKIYGAVIALEKLSFTVDAGKIQGVRYDELAPILLQEAQRQAQRNEEANPRRRRRCTPARAAAAG